MRYFEQSRVDAAFPWLLALLATAYVALHWSQPLTLWPDSGGYLAFSEHRTAGYPLFLDAVELLFGSSDAAPKVQLLIAATAFAFLGWSLHRAFRSPIFALVPVVALMLYPRIADLHAYILTESIFISLLCLMVGGIALSLQRPSWRWTALAALACGLAIIVRPAAISLLIVWPLLLWLTWSRTDRRRLALASAVIVPIALCLLVETLLWHAHHDSASRPNLVDRHLFAKSLLIDSEPSLSDPDLAAIVSLGRQVFAPGRALIADAPSHYARTRLLVDFEVAAQHSTYSRVFSPLVREVADRRGVDEYRLLARIARPAILSEPVAWVRNALAHYLGLWFPYWAYVSPAVLNEYQAYIESAEPDELFGDNPIFGHKEPPGPRLAFAVRTTLAAGLAVSLLSFALAAWQRLRAADRSPDPRLALAATAGLAVHAHFLLIGLTGVVATRYAGAMAPLLAVCGVLTASWLLDHVEAPMSLLRTRNFRFAGLRSGGGGVAHDDYLLPPHCRAAAVPQRGGRHSRRRRVLPAGPARSPGLRVRQRLDRRHRGACRSRRGRGDVRAAAG